MQNAKEKIILIPLLHSGIMCIGIRFDPKEILSQAVRKTKHVRWSQSNKCWYLPFKQECYDELLKNVSPLTQLDNSSLKQFKKQAIRRDQIDDVNTNPARISQPTTHLKPVTSIAHVNHHVLTASGTVLLLIY